ncbi:Transposase [Salinivirga cyanobacteriivorans]|uniref:Transposase n=1 Tax=Salinivirga cyanobacteriivorans TaxID=1307839 RepID=A0A0S2I4P9_9BACT|nr:IS1634 family transposase [Salinivirga cyanobacteriivorans]ALO17173.1 Transposase [Salinivirga cyanobacteriivorans]ALO17439.1 Transposase [Salinivirga cyanobacteriivorans]
MFVRKKKNKSGSVSIQIIKKIDRSNKVIKTIGSSSEPDEIERLYYKALYELPRLYGPTLFDPLKESRICDLTNDDIHVVGPELIFSKIFNYIGFNQIKDELFKALCISRITHPGSKLNLSLYLQENHKSDISVDRIYYFMDRLNSRYKKQVEEISFQYTKKVLGGKIGIVFYDMTTIYFESSQPDELKQTGFSKDGKHQHPQIFLGLLVGKEGYPIGYDIFEGSIYEGHTLIPILEKFERRFSLNKPIVVADAGLLSAKNIESLKINRYTFILGARIKNENNIIKKQIRELNLQDGQIAKIEKPDNTVLFISFSDKRAKKDLSNRERGLKRLEKSLNAGRLTKSNINNRGYNKYLKMQGELKINIDYEKFRNDSTWDGLKGYLTNTKLSGKEVIENYNNLWKIEKAFRISKTDLKIRPIYHRLKERIEAHICISFVSYLLYKDLEKTLKENDTGISINKAIKAINKMYEIQVGNKRILLRNNETQQNIIDLINSKF